MIAVPNYRVLVALESKEALPDNYRRDIQKWIYCECLGGTKIGEWIHQSKYTLYSFSMRPVVIDRSGKGYRSANGSWVFQIGSAHREVLATIESEISNANYLKLAGVDFRIQGIYREDLVDRNQFSVTPILVIEKETKEFLTPESPLFGQAVAASLSNRFKFFTGKEAGPIDFSYIGTPKKKLIRYDKRRLLSFQGEVRLQADQQLRIFAQAVGLGQKPSAGFGFIL